MLLWVTLSLAAPSCLPGQTVVAEGHCCWPGQRWIGACSGVPECPEGTVAEGTNCRSETRLMGAVETSSGKGVVDEVPSPVGLPAGRLYVATVPDGAVSFGDPTVLGGLEGAPIIEAIRSRASAIVGCSVVGGASATLRLVSDATGKVTTATARDAAPSAFGTCLSTSALTWTLPPSAGGIVVTTVPVAVAAR